MNGIVQNTDDILVAQVNHDNKTHLIVTNSTDDHNSTGNQVKTANRSDHSSFLTKDDYPTEHNHDTSSPLDLVTGQITRFSNIQGLSSTLNRNFRNHHPSMKGGSFNPSTPIRLSALRPAALMAGSQLMNSHGTGTMSGSLAGHGRTMRQSFVDNCGSNVRLHDRKGRINSPNYPSHWGNRTSCTWIIVGQPKDIVTIR